MNHKVCNFKGIKDNILCIFISFVIITAVIRILFCLSAQGSLLACLGHTLSMERKTQLGHL